MQQQGYTIVSTLVIFVYIIIACGVVIQLAIYRNSVAPRF